MSQQSVEMILVRQLAGYLFVPVVVVDTAGTVIFYNEPAERILGVRFEETGRIDREEADRLIELSEIPRTARTTPDDPCLPRSNSDVPCTRAAGCCAAATACACRSSSPRFPSSIRRSACSEPWRCSGSGKAREGHALRRARLSGGAGPCHRALRRQHVLRARDRPRRHRPRAQRRDGDPDPLPAELRRWTCC
jgi:hypothetical protein